MQDKAPSIEIVHGSMHKTHFIASHYREIHYLYSRDHKIRRVSDANYYWY